MAMADGTQFPVFIPNDTLDGDGFHVSYNRYDRSTYGSDTTALVIGQSHFYILNGNHVAAYAPLIQEGLSACIHYFEANIDQINMYSERDPEVPAGPRMR